MLSTLWRVPVFVEKLTLKRGQHTEDLPRRLPSPTFNHILNAKAVKIGRCYLQWLSARITRIYVVPEFDVVLIFFPAEKNFLAADERGKIHEAARQVLDDDFAVREALQQALDFAEQFDGLIDEVAAVSWPSAIRPAIRRSFFSRSARRWIRRVEPLPQLGQ